MSFLRLAAAAILCLSAFPAAAAAQAETEKTPRIISLTGLGSVTASPDLARISTGVATEGNTAREALAKNTAAMSRIVAEIKTQGLDPKDIQTTDFAIHPIYTHNKDGSQAMISGYRAVNSVTVTVRDIARLGEILDKVVSLGSNQIGGIEFAINDPESLQDRARRDAMTNASQKAKLYADAAGATLGRVMSISEEAIAPPPHPIYARAMEAKSADVPIEPGSEKLQIRLHVTWELQ